MLTEIYIEALPVDEELADQVWVLWNAGVITDELAARAWLLIPQVPTYWSSEIVASRREASAL